MLDIDRPFLRAIAAAPDDDLPRGRWKDYLMDTARLGSGREERAEFIDVQTALAALPPQLSADWEGGRCSLCGEDESLSSHWHCVECGAIGSMMGCPKPACRERSARRRDLRQREFELLDQYTLDWLGYGGWETIINHEDGGGEAFVQFQNVDKDGYLLEPSSFLVRFRGGFPEYVECDTRDWRLNGPKVTKGLPVRELNITDWRVAVAGGFYIVAACEPAPHPGFTLVTNWPEAFGERPTTAIDDAGEARKVASRMALEWARRQAKLPPLPTDLQKAAESR
jgi:uncharacterized protein (TIGR02996 family)